MSTQYVKTIRRQFPNLNIYEWEKIDLGQNNDVIMVNNTYIFRFPKYSKGIERLYVETMILDKLEKNTSLEIPNFLYKSFASEEVGKVFTGYKKIDGSPMWRDAIKDLEKKDKRYIVQQLTHFMREVHSVPLTTLEEEIKQTEQDTFSYFETLYEKIQEKLFIYMNNKAKKRVEHLFDLFLREEKNKKIENCLIHGDFGASNILWDNEEKIVTGVIDFGGSCISDPAYDFSGLLSSYGEEFLELCLENYPNSNQIFERVRFYRSTFALQEALHGIETGDKQAFENGITNYR